MAKTCLYSGDSLAAYGFGEGHPFGPDRHGAFLDLARQQGLLQHESIIVLDPVSTTDEVVQLFHDAEYVQTVRRMSKLGVGYLDQGDTPAHKGIYEAASTVVGCTVAAVSQIMSGQCQRGFVPIAGLHHARRNRAAGFCVFNDCAVAIEVLRHQFGVRKIAYVDIDAHHGDGVFYSYTRDQDLCFVDFHEDGQYLYPGTGFAHETGEGEATGTKLNIPLAPGATDKEFLSRWPQAEAFLEQAQPEFILLQCGADSLAGDPITHLQLSEQAHAYAAKRLCQLADVYANGRLLAMGGGGYNRKNLATAWCAVLEQLLLS